MDRLLEAVFLFGLCATAVVGGRFMWIFLGAVL